jgi:hypothetical protein
MTLPQHREQMVARLAVAGALVAHVLIVGSIILQPRPLIRPLYNDAIHRNGPGADFYAVYHAGVNMERGLSLYDSAPDGITPYYYPFRYLPAVAYVGRGLLAMRPETARRGWVVVLEGLLALVIMLLSRSIPQGSWRAFSIVVLLLSSPYFLELYMGQFTFAAVSLTLVGLFLPAGALAYAAGTVLKVVPIVAAPALLLHRRYWMHVALALGALILGSAPYFATHRDDMRFFLDFNVRSPGGLHSGNFGVVYLARLIADSMHADIITEHWEGVVKLARAVLLGGTAILVLLSKDRRPILGVCTLLLAHFVSFAHVWEHSMSAVALLGVALLGEEMAALRVRAVVAAAIVLLALPTPFVFLDKAQDPRVWDPSASWSPIARYMLLCPKALPTFALYAAGVSQLGRAGFARPWSQEWIDDRRQRMKRSGGSRVAGA